MLMPGKLVTFQPGPLRGSVGVPGDKSISHRALIAGACSAKPFRIVRLNPGRDVRATREALAALGADIYTEGDEVVVTGGRLVSPAGTLDCMNSGSTVRMLLGACAGAGVTARFDGDDSLRRRPMEPVAAQLRAFGAKIETTEGHLPLQLSETPEVETRHFILLTPSAQVKSALLFAGLFAGVAVSVDGDAAHAIIPNGCCASWVPTSNGRTTAFALPARRSLRQGSKWRVTFRLRPFSLPLR